MQSGSEKGGGGDDRSDAVHAPRSIARAVEALGSPQEVQRRLAEGELDYWRLAAALQLAECVLLCTRAEVAVAGTGGAQASLSAALTRGV